MTSLLQHVADWLLTWFLHATVACALAMLVGELLVRDPRLRDLLWKGSLVAPIATSLISVLVGRTSIELGNWAHAHAPGRLGAVSVSVQGSLSAASQVRVDDPIAQWLPAIVIAFLVLPAAVACLAAVRRHRSLRNDLRTRRRLDISKLGVDVRALALRGAAAQITISPQISSAAALYAREICVSPRFLSLGKLEKEGVLAHELAHLERSDLVWQQCADFISAALIAQPLARLVARRLRRDAEFICDEIAIRRTGDPVAYLRALVAFADRQDPQSVSAVAYGSSQIVERAERIVAIGAASLRGATERLAIACAAILLLGAVLALPRIDMRSNYHRAVAQVITQNSAAVQVQVNVDH